MSETNSYAEEVAAASSPVLALVLIAWPVATITSVMQMSEDGENAGPESLINEAFGAYAELDNWKNKVEIMAGGEAGAAAPATLTITLQDNGSGEVTLQ